MIALPTPLPSSAWWVTMFLGARSGTPSAATSAARLPALVAEDVVQALVHAVRKARVFLSGARQPRLPSPAGERTL
jgi:hypothetical protein